MTYKKSLPIGLNIFITCCLLKFKPGVKSKMYLNIFSKKKKKKKNVKNYLYSRETCDLIFLHAVLLVSSPGVNTAKQNKKIDFPVFGHFGYFGQNVPFMKITNGNNINETGFALSCGKMCIFKSITLLQIRICLYNLLLLCRPENSIFRAPESDSPNKTAILGVIRSRSITTEKSSKYST